MSESRWPKVPLGTLLRGIYDGPHATPHKTTTGPVFLGISNLSRGRLDLSSVEHLSEEDFPLWTRRVTPTAGDVVFSYETRLGEAALIPKGLRCCLGRRMGLLRVDPDQASARFILYAWLAPEFQQEIRRRTNAGSTVDRILLTELSTFPIACPPLNEQITIGRFLGALDEKIELNRATNSTLFTFIDTAFAAWQLEQRNCVDWSVGELLSLEYGHALPATARQSGMTVVMGSNGQVGWHDMAMVQGPGIVVGRKGTPGTVTWVDSDFWPIDTTFYVVPEQHVRLPFLFFALRRLNLPFLAADSAVPGLNRNAVYMTRIQVPDDDAQQCFSDVASTFFKAQAANVRQNRTLAELRDLLLPKLVSGEIRIKDAEEVVQSVV